MLARIADDHHLTLVHYSTDYVFDGTAQEHTEDEPFSPLGVYAQAKAAGDIAVATAHRHYVLRTSWVIGDGNNFVRTMQTLAGNGVSPTVVSDQVGRLTFTDELARATAHLLESAAAYGTYNVSNGGPAMSWADIAARGLRAVRPLGGRRHPLHHRGVRRRQGHGSPPGVQHAEPGEARGDRLRARPTRWPPSTPTWVTRRVSRHCPSSGVRRPLAQRATPSRV